MITVPTLSEIYASMRADAQSLMESDAPIPQLSLLNVLIVVFSGAMRLAYGHLYNVAAWILPDQAQGRFLDRLLDIYKIPVATGSASEGAVICQGTEATVIPEGTLLVRIDGTGYKTLVESVIESTGYSKEIPIQCTQLGPSGNYTGSELTFSSPITDVLSTATVSTTCVGGSNADTEVDSRNKLLSRIRTPNTVGVATDYQRMALSVDGVGRVWSQGGDYWTGPNTVALTLATSDNTPVSATTLQNVIDKMEQNTNKQPGIVVGVYPLSVIPVELTLKVTGTITNIPTTLEAFFRDGIAPGELLKIADIYSAITMSGCENFEILSMRVDGVDTPIGDVKPSATAFKKFSYGGVVYAN